MKINLEMEFRDGLDLHSAVLDGYRKEQQYRLGLMELETPSELETRLIVAQGETLERLERVWLDLNAKLGLAFPTLEQFWSNVDNRVIDQD